MRTLIGHEYEVRCEDFERGDLGWFRAKFMTPHAKEMEWLWEIDDPKFARLKLNEVNIVEVRPISNARPHGERSDSVQDWCACKGWKKIWPHLQNYNEMNFCIACGKKLTKKANAPREGRAIERTLDADVGSDR